MDPCVLPNRVNIYLIETQRAPSCWVGAKTINQRRSRYPRTFGYFECKGVRQFFSAAHSRDARCLYPGLLTRWVSPVFASRLDYSPNTGENRDRRTESAVRGIVVQVRLSKLQSFLCSGPTGEFYSLDAFRTLCFFKNDRQREGRASDLVASTFPLALSEDDASKLSEE